MAGTRARLLIKQNSWENVQTRITRSCCNSTRTTESRAEHRKNFHYCAEPLSYRQQTSKGSSKKLVGSVLQPVCGLFSLLCALTAEFKQLVKSIKAFILYLFVNTCLHETQSFAMPLSIWIKKYFSCVSGKQQHHHHVAQQNQKNLNLQHSLLLA